MLKEERFNHILGKLNTSNKINFEEIALDLGVSEDTVRRDIDRLSRNGLLVKVRGGAISPSVNPLSFQDRENRFTDAKKRIALKAQPLLMDAQTVFMDGGTTMLAIASCIPLAARLRIITNNVALVSVLADHSDIEIIVLGGTYNRITQTNVGVQTCQQAQNYRADLYLMGICSIDSRAGITSSLQADGEVKQVMMRSAGKIALLCNGEKLETVDYFNVSGLTQVDALITDLASDDSQLDAYRQFDLQLI